MIDVVLGHGQVLTIGQVQVMVVKIEDNRVRLGIAAPTHVPVHRREVYLELLRQRDCPRDPPGDNGPKESP